MNKAFILYFGKLYNSEKEVDWQKQNRFLDKLNIPSIKEEDIDYLEWTIMKEELEKSIDSMNSRKRGRPDCLWIDIYKNFTLGDILETFINESSTQRVNDTLIYIVKPLSPLRPKILCKIVVRWLQKFIYNYIFNILYSKKNRFLAGRQGFHNVSVTPLRSRDDVMWAEHQAASAPQWLSTSGSTMCGLQTPRSIPGSCRCREAYHTRKQ